MDVDGRLPRLRRDPRRVAARRGNAGGVDVARDRQRSRAGAMLGQELRSSTLDRLLDEEEELLREALDKTWEERRRGRMQVAAGGARPMHRPVRHTLDWALVSLPLLSSCTPDRCSLHSRRHCSVDGRCRRRARRCRRSSTCDDTAVRGPARSAAHQIPTRRRSASRRHRWATGASRRPVPRGCAPMTRRRGRRR